jgi:uncharacterized membrane protein
MNKTGNEVGNVSPSFGILLVCFDEPKKAQQVKEALEKEIRQGGDLILDEMVMRVDEKRKVQVHEMGKAARGAAIVALTWGVFGLLSGGLRGLVIWAVLGAVCGGIYFYYVAHTLSDAELKNIARRMPPNSSVLLAFLKTSHAQQIIDSVSRYTPAASSLVTVGEGMATSVISGTSEKAEQPSPASTPVQAGADGDNPFSILVFRYTGHQTARQVEAELKEEWKKAGDAIQTEVMIEVDEQKKVHVYDPSTGVRAQTISSMISWGLCGLIVGVLTGLFSGGGGLLGIITSGLTRLITWGAFGIVAGALAAFVVNRAIPTSRLKKMSMLFSRTQADTSVILALVQGTYTQKMISDLSTHDARGLVIRVKTPSSFKGGLELAVSNAV